jgi:glycosyltransferase involved in cell wall biosynthesis
VTIPAATNASLALVVLTFNEERNLAACLQSVAGWLTEVFVVDSGSTDRTVAIAQQFGATVASHPFESHARQWRWALATLPIRAQWVLALDADQAVSEALRHDIDRRLSEWEGPQSPAGAYVNRRQIFRGRWIRHGGYYPKYLLKLFRRDAVSVDETDLVDHHFHVAGSTALLEGDLIEDNRNEYEIAAWIAKHNRYAVLQARQELNPLSEIHRRDRSPSVLGSPDERTLARKRVWNRLPLYVRPFGYFFYRYVIRLGFLDGKQGFVFHFLQAFWYRLLVDINRDELTAGRQPSLGVASSATGQKLVDGRPFQPLNPGATSAEKND